jgi:hypothetical protein
VREGAAEPPSTTTASAVGRPERSVEAQGLSRAPRSKWGIGVQVVKSRSAQDRPDAAASLQRRLFKKWTRSAVKMSSDNPRGSIHGRSDFKPTFKLQSAGIGNLSSCTKKPG